MNLKNFFNYCHLPFDGIATPIPHSFRFSLFSSPFWNGGRGKKQWLFHYLSSSKGGNQGRFFVNRAVPDPFVLNNSKEMDAKEIKQPLKEKLIRRYAIIGSRRLSNYWWATVLLLGAVGFLLTGISSYLNVKLLPFIDIEKIVFFPQGLVMCFYGLLGLFLSFYLWFTLFLDIGGGFNEINKKQGQFRIFRWGFPGKNRRIDLQYPIDEVLAIRLEVQEGSNSKRVISLKLSGQREIVFTGGEASQWQTFEQLEKQASELAKFLQLPLELGS